MLYKTNETKIALRCVFHSYFITFRMAPVMNRDEIFEVWVSASTTDRSNAVYDFVLQRFGQVDFPEEVVTTLKVFLRSLCQQIEIKWSKCHRHRGDGL